MKEDVKIGFRGLRLSAVFGLILAIAGVYYLYMYYTIDLPTETYYACMVSYTTMTIIGFYLMLERSMSESRAVYIGGFAIGLATVLQNIKPYPDVLFYFFDMIIGFVILLMAVANLFGYRFNVTRSAYMVALLIFMSILPMVIDYFMDYTVKEILVYYQFDFPMLFVYIVYLVIITRKGIWYPRVVTRVSDHLNVIESTMHTGGEEFIEPADLAVFTDPDRSGWDHPDRGPVECERRIRLWDPSHDTCLLVQKWRSEDCLRVTILPEGHGQLSNGFQFRVVSHVVSESGDSITLYDDAGTFVRIMVKERVVSRGLERITRSGGTHS